MGSKEEPEKKRRHGTTTTVSSPPPKKQSLSPPYDKKVDTADLQHENHKLAQQLDAQRTEIHDLETKLQELKRKQMSYDESLASIQDSWEELEENLELLLARANSPIDGLKVLRSSCVQEEEKTVPIAPEEMFLHRFLHSCVVSSNGNCNGSLSIERALEQRQVSTLELVENLLQAIETEHTKNAQLSAAIENETSLEECVQQLDILFEDTRTEIKTLRSVMESLDARDRELVSEINSCKEYHDRSQAQLNRLKGELEETLADLETSRRKLAAMRNQNDARSMSGSRDGISKENRALEAALEEAKNLASQRLDELKEMQQEKFGISQKILTLQEYFSDEKYILSSEPYVGLVKEAESLRAELEHYQLLVEEAQVEHDQYLHHEKEKLLKTEEADAAEKLNNLLKVRVGELEAILEKHMAEKIELQARVEKATLSSERKDEIAELKIVVSTLHKEMRMMQQQLNQHKQETCGLYSLRAAVKSMNEILDRKTNECKDLSEKVAGQSKEIVAMNEEARLLRESEEELKLIIDMYGRESTDSKEARKLKQAECRAWAQVERLKTAIDEHSLELKVKEAIEAEAACQQRLAMAEAEVAELRQKLDASDREVTDVNDMLRMKTEEGDAYLAEIETIGQAYEDMQTQNQRLLQQISERDDYNLKLIYESFKTKQVYASLIEQKQILTNRLKQINTLGDCFKQRAARLEEYVRTYSEQIAKAMDENRQYINDLEQAKRKFVDTEKELANSKLSLQSARKELKKQRSKIMDVEVELEKERFERKRIEEELTIVNMRASPANANNDNRHLVEKLQDEIDEYKAILKCSVCHNRSKEVVITKCFHLFCGPCIQRNLETRHRKCPRCGIVFGQNDVRNVYI